MMDAFFPLLLIAAGAILAFAGRRMIHLAIAIAGFMLFYLLAVTLLPASGSLVQLLVGVLGGLLGAWLATRFFRLVVAIAGFIFAGWIGMSLAETLGWTGTSATLVFLAAGIIGLILVGTVFDTTMILLTAISGAMLLLNGLDDLTSISALETYRIPLLILLAGVGAYVQWRTRR
jgi:hypothetical protein